MESRHKNKLLKIITLNLMMYFINKRKGPQTGSPTSGIYCKNDPIEDNIFAKFTLLKNHYIRYVDDIFLNCS